jgi:hypothetical protein
LWLDARALLAGDLAAALRTLNLGLATAEHAAFAARPAGPAAPYEVSICR